MLSSNRFALLLATLDPVDNLDTLASIQPIVARLARDAQFTQEDFTLLINAAC